MDSTSVSDQIPIDVQEFDPLLLTPDNEDDLPKSGHELAAQYPDGPISDFYKEVGNGLSDEWLSLSDEEKRVIVRELLFTGGSATLATYGIELSF